MTDMCKNCEKVPACEQSNYCETCNDILWTHWSLDHAKEIKKARKLRAGGHTIGCAWNMAHGDGICRCGGREEK
jgi:hypothetical protein